MKSILFTCSTRSALSSGGIYISHFPTSVNTATHGATVCLRATPFKHLGIFIFFCLTYHESTILSCLYNISNTGYDLPPPFTPSVFQWMTMAVRLFLKVPFRPRTLMARLPLPLLPLSPFPALQLNRFPPLRSGRSLHPQTVPSMPILYPITRVAPGTKRIKK